MQAPAAAAAGSLGNAFRLFVVSRNWSGAQGCVSSRAWSRQAHCPVGTHSAALSYGQAATNPMDPAMKTRLMIAASLALATAACTTAPAPRYGYETAPKYSQPQRCYDCGRIERIEPVYGARSNSRTGAVLGGLVGAVVAREVPSHGSDGRKNTATVAGAAAGALAGNAIENKMNEQTYDIQILMDDGRRVVVNKNNPGNNLRVGSYVRVDGNSLTLLR
jgi:outer membrane lipoprotein SlyB